MARRRKMGKLSTGAVVGIAAGAAVVLYFVMRKPTVPVLPAGYIPPPGSTGPSAAALQAQASTTNTAINDASSTINNLINSIFS